MVERANDLVARVFGYDRADTVLLQALPYCGTFGLAQALAGIFGLLAIAWALSEARGTLAGKAALSWGRNGLAGGADLVIEGLSFTGKDLKVSGLDLSLVLDSLQPPASPPQIGRAHV